MSLPFWPKSCHFLAFSVTILVFTAINVLTLGIHRTCIILRHIRSWFEQFWPLPSLNHVRGGVQKVFNLFASSIPQEGLSRMERGRKVQSIVPDMRISIPEEGNSVPRFEIARVKNY